MVLRTNRNRRAAFTLMEMLVVVAIIVALAGVGGYFLLQTLAGSEKDVAKVQARVLTDACNEYKIRNKQWPDSLEQLLQKDAKGYGPYLESRDNLKDPWGKDYVYDRGGGRNNGSKPDIYTTAPDGTQVGNWPANQ
jgi:general secretion pathway protein G